MKKMLLTVASLGLESGDLPEWYTIFPEGTGEVEGVGRYLLTTASYEMVQAEIARRGIEVVFDYEHQTVKDTKAPAAGWCREWRWQDGVGIQAKIDWTDEAAEYLQKGEYRYYSPVFYTRKRDGLLCRVHSVALTNAPRTNQLKPLLAKLGAELEEDQMELLKQLIAALGLAEDATEEQVLAEIKALKEGPKEVMAKAVLDALELDAESGESVVVASIHALKQAPKGMVSKADFDALQAKIVQREAGEAVAGAISAGKITPDQKEWAAKYAADDPDGFATFVAKAPVVVPVGKLPEDKRKPGDPIDDTVLNVAKLMGVTEEDLKEFGGVQ